VWINAELVLWIYSEEVYVDLELHSVCGSTSRKCMLILSEVVLWICSNEVYVNLG
jgi:hypothetical protein